MSTPAVSNENSVEVATPAGGGQRGRGSGRGTRGGRGGSRGGSVSANNRQGQQDLPKSQIGPKVVGDMKYTDEATLMGKAFVIYVGAAGHMARQVTFHRPIGYTALDKDEDWVCTPTSDMRILMERAKSPETSEWEAQKEAFIRQQVLEAGKGRKLDSSDPPREVWTFAGSPQCGARVNELKAAARAANKKESDWLTFASVAERECQKAFIEALESFEVPKDWLEKHPCPPYQTKGGPFADRPQTAVPYLKGKHVSAAMDAVMMRISGIDPVNP